MLLHSAILLDAMRGTRLLRPLGQVRHCRPSACLRAGVERAGSGGSIPAGCRVRRQELDGTLLFKRLVEAQDADAQQDDGEAS
jgi:hypothetical protein